MKLNQRIILVSIIPLIISTLIISGIIAYFISNELFDSTLSKIEALCDLAESQMQNPMNNLDVDELNEIIDNLENEENIIQVLVLFPDGRLLTDGTDDDFNYGKIIEDDFVQMAIFENDKMIMIEDSVIYASKPISLNEKIGILIIEYSTQKINSVIQNTIYSIITTATIILCASGFIAYYLSKIITNPILKIKDATNDISKGNFKNFKIDSKISEINELADQIYQMAEKLDRYQKEKIKTERLAAIGELSSRITHDLRNPLSALKMVIEIMKKKNPDVVKENQKYFDMMQNAILRMTHQIDEVLGFIKIRPIKKEYVKFSEIISSVVKTFNLPKNIKILIPEIDNKILCDKLLFQNVLINLISNSIQSIDKKEGQIIVGFERQEKFDRITVEDSGSGIPEDSLEIIFEPLFTTKQTGTGLGLVSCRNTINAHDGKIFAQNLSKGGVMFTMLIPNLNEKINESK